MRRNALRVLAAVAAAVSGVALVLVPQAGAQTGYPPGACTTPTGSQDVGGVNVGSTFTVRVQPGCVFDVGGLVSLTVNGQNIGTKAADATGGINVVVRVVSTTQLEIDDPVQVPAQCGVNTIVASGQSGGTPVMQTASFTVLCPGGPATPVRGRVAFTGANVLRWGGGAAALVALGGVLLVVARRRSRASTTA